MAKSATKPARAKKTGRAIKRPQPKAAPASSASKSALAHPKQSRLLAMLQSPAWRNDCRDDEGDGLAAAFGAWFPRRCRSQAPEAEAQFGQGRRGSRLSRCERRLRSSRLERPCAHDKRMATQAIGRAARDRKSLDVEIVRLRGLDLGALQSRWHALFGGERPLTCPGICCFGFWPTACRPTRWATSIPRASGCSTAQPLPRKPGQRAMARRAGELRPGTMLAREWNGEMQRVAVLPMALLGRARPIQASPRWLLPSQAHVGTDRGSSACATRLPMEHRHESRRSETAFAARSTRASRPTKVLNRTSTLSMRSTMPRRLTSAAKRMPGGRCCGASTTMAASPAATPTALPCSGSCRRASRQDRCDRRLQGRSPYSLAC